MSLCECWILYMGRPWGCGLLLNALVETYVLSAITYNYELNKYVWLALETWYVMRHTFSWYIVHVVIRLQEKICCLVLTSKVVRWIPYMCFIDWCIGVFFGWSINTIFFENFEKFVLHYFGSIYIVWWIVMNYKKANICFESKFF